MSIPFIVHPYKWELRLIFLMKFRYASPVSCIMQGRRLLMKTKKYNILEFHSVNSWELLRIYFPIVYDCDMLLPLY